jgi:AraC-like DNA-binding protein
MINKTLTLNLNRALLGNTVAKKSILVMDENSMRGNHLVSLLSGFFSTRLVRMSALIPEFMSIAPDIIIIDMNFTLPGTIEEFIIKMRSNPRYAETIIVLLAHTSNGASIVSALQAGAHTYIMYPIDAELLLLTMKKLSALKEQSSEWINDWLTHPALMHMEHLKPHLYEDEFKKRFEKIVAKYIEEEIPSVQKISVEMSQSIATLGRWVKKIYGVTPKKFIMDHKLYVAEMMLRHKSGTVRDIAYRLGFHSVSYFCYLFKERYGCSPGSILGKYRE